MSSVEKNYDCLSKRNCADMEGWQPVYRRTMDQMKKVAPKRLTALVPSPNDVAATMVSGSTPV
jgi:hypothetical protein